MIGLEWGDVDLVKRQMCIQRSEWRGHVTVPKGGRLQGHRHLKSKRVLCFRRWHERFRSWPDIRI